jgi:Tat protein translocase TatB subunit
VFGVSFLELALVAVVALMVVGPKKLPTLMRTLGEWVGKIRKMTTEMRAQTGIDDILRQEGIDGVHELRSLLRGEIHAAKGRHQHDYLDPEGEDVDLLAEYPVEGADSYGAIAEDLVLLANPLPHPEAQAPDVKVVSEDKSLQRKPETP